jgi:hypothetical protein
MMQWNLYYLRFKKFIFEITDGILYIYISHGKCLNDLFLNKGCYNVANMCVYRHYRIRGVLSRILKQQKRGGE